MNVAFGFKTPAKSTVERDARRISDWHYVHALPEVRGRTTQRDADGAYGMEPRASKAKERILEHGCRR
jgi:hypothetical protein